MNLLGLFSVGFVLGLTGAMAPGPMLTVTISESTRKGGIIGPLLVLGHGILEFVLLCVIVFGLGNLLNNNLLFSVIAFFGGIILIYMGSMTIKDLKHYSLDGTSRTRGRGIHPVAAGILVSLSNPYWFIWWITIGMGYVMFARGLGFQGVIAFFTGHILSDLAWYSFVSYGIQFGGRYMSIRVLKTILFVCSIFLISFGIFFIIKGYNFIR